MTSAYDTIVVGLGAAGAAAASTLARAGRRVLALEALGRLGGRVHTVDVPGGVVEVGAEWIHGTEQSAVYEAAVAHQVNTVPQDLTLHVYRSDGLPGDTALVNELVDYCLGVVDRPPDRPEPLGSFITRSLMGYLKEHHPSVLKDEDFITGFLELMNQLVNNYEASDDWRDVTTHTHYRELGGHQHVSWHRYGYRTLFHILLNTYNNGPGWPTLDVKLNKEVTRITWAPHCTADVTVACSDGAVYTARSVIVTVSLGVLKERHATLFTPPLPPEKVQVIDKLSIGVMDKVILQFERQWLPAGAFYALMWRAEERARVAPADRWTTRVFACSTPMGARAALTFWTSGETAKLVETLPEDVVKRKLMELVRRFLGKHISIPEPIGMIRSTWYSNPYTRGSYTHDTAAAGPSPGARAALGAPLRDAAGAPRVLFAGEATDRSHFSTVHGACASGRREAARLLPRSAL